MASRREIQAAINLRQALRTLREIYGNHLEANNLEWLASKTLQSIETKKKLLTMNQPKLESPPGIPDRDRPPTLEEREFYRLFGRFPDEHDHEYGVTRLLQDSQWLGEFMGLEA